MAGENEESVEQTWEQKLLQKLGSSKALEIEGVVDANGNCGSHSPKETLWTLLFTFSPWKFAGGEIKSREIIIRKPLSKSEYDELSKTIRAFDVWRARVRVAEGTRENADDGLLIELLGKSSDKELLFRAQDLKEPIVIKDPSFGSFLLDRRVNWLAGSAKWLKKAVKLNLSMDGATDQQQLLSTARILWGAQADWDKRVRECATAKLLPLKNSAWLDEDQGEKELTTTQFNRRMKMESITVHADGRIDFWFDDGELFFGHSIAVHGTLKDGPTHAEMCG